MKRTRRLPATRFINQNTFPPGATVITGPHQIAAATFVDQDKFFRAKVAPLTMEIARRLITQERRRRGGLRSSAAKQQKSAAAYEKYDAIWAAGRGGRNYAGLLRLRRIIKNEMARDGFADPQGNQVPSDRALRRRYPAK